MDRLPRHIMSQSTSRMGPRKSNIYFKNGTISKQYLVNLCFRGGGPEEGRIHNHTLPNLTPRGDRFHDYHVPLPTSSGTLVSMLPLFSRKRIRLAITLCQHMCLKKPTSKSCPVNLYVKMRCSVCQNPRRGRGRGLLSQKDFVVDCGMHRYRNSADKHLF